MENKPKIKDELWSMHQVTEFLGCSRHSVYRWMQELDFPGPSFKARRSVRWSMLDVQEWAAKQHPSAKTAGQ